MNTFKAKKARQKYKVRLSRLQHRRRARKAWLTKEAMERDMQHVNDKMAEAKTEKGPPYKMGGVIEYINKLIKRL